MKRPSFQFYPGDWLNNPKLKLADWEVKGLWMDLLCHMHNDYHYGYIRVGDQYLDETAIQRLLNANPKRFHRVFKQLVTLNIIAHDELGFHSSRMVEDERLRRIRAEAGKQGGNPNLVNRKNNQNIEQNPTPSSSSSSSSSVLSNGKISSEAGASDGKHPAENVSQAEKSAKAVKKKGNAGPIDPSAREAVKHLSETLQNHGALPGQFSTQWFFASARVAERLLKVISQPDLQTAITWLVEQPASGQWIRTMADVEKNLTRWQRRDEKPASGSKPGRLQIATFTQGGRTNFD